MSYWKKAALCAASAATALVLAAAPAAAAVYPTSNFGPAYDGPSYGATWARGTLTWYARGVHVQGELRTLASSGCRKVRVNSIDSRALLIPGGESSTKAKCGDAVHPIEFTVPADVPGGAASVLICLEDANDQRLFCSGRNYHP